MDFDERQLRAFIAIADTGSLGRAARVVNLTQPSLSRLVQGIEERLGHRLFDRGCKGMALTDGGRLLLPHARHLVAEMQNTRDELAALRGLRRGTVRIGAVAAVLRTLVASAIGGVLVETPDLAFELVEGVDGELLDALLTRRIDLAVSSQPLDHDEVVPIGECTYRDSFAVFCAASHTLPPRPTLAQAMTRGWVMPGHAFTPRGTFEEIVRRHSLTPRVVVECGSVEAMIAVSASSELLCWLPEPLLAPHLASGAMRKLDIAELALQRRFILHRRKSGLLPDAASQFVRHFPLVGSGA